MSETTSDFIGTFSEFDELGPEYAALPEEPLEPANDSEAPPAYGNDNETIGAKETEEPVSRGLEEILKSGQGNREDWERVGAMESKGEDDHWIDREAGVVRDGAGNVWTNEEDPALHQEMLTAFLEGRDVFFYPDALEITEDKETVYKTVLFLVERGDGKTVISWECFKFEKNHPKDEETEKSDKDESGEEAPVAYTNEAQDSESVEVAAYADADAEAAYAQESAGAAAWTEVLDGSFSGMPDIPDMAVAPDAIELAAADGISASAVSPEALQHHAALDLAVADILRGDPLIMPETADNARPPAPVETHDAAASQHAQERTPDVRFPGVDRISVPAAAEAARSAAAAEARVPRFAAGGVSAAAAVETRAIPTVAEKTHEERAPHTPVVSPERPHALSERTPYVRAERTEQGVSVPSASPAAERIKMEARASAAKEEGHHAMRPERAQAHASPEHASVAVAGRSDAAISRELPSREVPDNAGSAHKASEPHRVASVDSAAPVRDGARLHERPEVTRGIVAAGGIAVGSSARRETLSSAEAGRETVMRPRAARAEDLMPAPRAETFSPFRPRWPFAASSASPARPRSHPVVVRKDGITLRRAA